jgi:hypothetical protein
MADETKQDTWLGINTIQAEDPSKVNEAYQAPITNWLDQLKNKPSFDKLDSERFNQARQLMSDSEIANFTSMSIFNNLLKKSEEYDRTQKLENSNEASTKQQEALANQKKIEDSKIYIEFYNERERPKIASENENSQEKGPQINGVDKIRGG